MDNLYRDHILDHYRNPRNFGQIPNPDSSSSEGNPLCGDKSGEDLKSKTTGNKKIIKEMKFHGEGCAISIASASLLSENIKGKTVKEALRLDKDFVLGLLGIDLSPTRLKCALLALETTHQAIRKSQRMKKPQR